MKRVAAALAALLLITAGCSKHGAPSVIPGTLRIALPIVPTQLNPILAQNTSENFLAGLTFSLLVEVDDKGREVPDLAAVVPTVQNGGISKDGRTIVYHLRRNVKWQDGYPFTSKDVLFTFHAIMNPNNNVVEHTGYDQIASMTAPDAYTVVMHMKRFYAPAIDTIFSESDSPFRILPAHLLARYRSLNNVPFDSNPIGTGPFRFVRWLRGDRIELAANDGYFRGRPKLNSIVVKIIDDANTTESELRAHEVDLALEISAVTFNNLANDSSVRRLVARGPSYTAVFFNLSHPPLDDVRVRRALALAIDRGQIVRDDTYGTGEIAVADLSRYYWAFDDALAPLPFDPRQAGALLDRAGWRIGPGGVRRKGGKPLELQLVYGTGSQSDRDLVVQIQQMLSKVGVTVEPKGYNFAQLYAAAQAGGIITGGKYDLTIYGWVAGADPDDSSTWLSSMFPPVGNNVTRYRSREMDAAQRQALSTFDRASRKRAYAKIQALLLRDVPGTFVYYAGLRYAYTPALTNFKPNGVSEGWNAYDWNI